MKFCFAILKNESESDHLEWIQACEQSHEYLNFEVVDLTKNDWLEKVQSRDFDCFLARPPGEIAYFKQLYDERLYVIYKILRKRIYPSYEEILIYENKKMLAYWLKVNQIPHAKTWIFYHKGEAIEFMEKCKLPLVAKTSIGASGSGVRIINNRKDLKNYINAAFSDKGIPRKWGPNLRKGNITKRTFNRLKNIPGLIKYLCNKKKLVSIDPQKWFVIFQDYIQCDYEWRCVRIGDSFFAHKKMRSFGEMISGTSKVSWDTPPAKLLDFVKSVTDKGDFLSQAVDILEDKNGNYYVNELQCFFGSKNPHQMIIDGKPGRYIYKDSNWIFEEGNFNSNNSFDLRLKHVIELLEIKKYSK
jgi:glutathione synthase/RimK-type ligase-like ATP-grasp enzyme